MSTSAARRQTRIACMMMRGGTSKGGFFLADDLPADPATRDRVLLAVMGSPDKRQIDGIGGADPLTSKVAIVSRSARPDADVDYLFAQVVVDEARVDYGQNCGNMLAAVGPFAIERGLVPAADGTTKVAIHMVNTGQTAVATVQTPGGYVCYEGDTRIDGVPGTAAPIPLAFKDTAGSTCGALLPTGNARDTIGGVDVTCIDNGMPLVLIRAADLGRTGYESREALDADTELKARVEAIRLKAGPMMKLGDVAARTVPKMCLIAPPRATPDSHGSNTAPPGTISTRSFIPHRCHASIGVLGAVSVATAAVMPGTVCDGVAAPTGGMRRRVSVEHPTGEFTVELEMGGTPEAPAVVGAALLRTARWMFDGEVGIATSVWDGKRLDGTRLDGTRLDGTRLDG
ncbi:4-oxalomesaconate tautomerase [Trinickia caryophylli]|uniref:4-oxalomesaconate tautomerase n=1 Tax=Trinickia caryophylli TaxID=28094 RepID=A0A1X7FDE0_TRICW|nr:4-oxalomesaconate tautomerase [Trinickia caryophylli]PMS10874.1 4-oxalomesaconate tautomerase [Trinickia caryophylli]TRX18817.1 4-oxalomesaconate tautomerase [Trinickia caryophylli]WQE10384.1 4-oxalomesaconate tautomerase [Trinickia caryophylli]SMF49953.1 4-oxalomesaconate tautomerase [Trinickia caryophylli]GLU34166.1 FldA protein [Trinickia caryophylli]